MSGLDVTIRQFKDSAGEIRKEEYIEAYLRLFNDKESLKYLSLIDTAFARKQLLQEVSRAEADGVEYRCAIDQETEAIVGILITRDEAATGFEIIGLAVDARFRRSVSRMLLGEAACQAAFKGYLAIIVAIYADNKDIYALLWEEGFKPVRADYNKRYGGEDGVWFIKSVGR